MKKKDRYELLQRALKHVRREVTELADANYSGKSDDRIDMLVNHFKLIEAELKALEREAYEFWREGHEFVTFVSGNRSVA